MNGFKCPAVFHGCAFPGVIQPEHAGTHSTAHGPTHSCADYHACDRHGNLRLDVWRISEEVNQQATVGRRGDEATALECSSHRTVVCRKTQNNIACIGTVGKLRHAARKITREGIRHGLLGRQRMRDNMHRIVGF